MALVTKCWSIQVTILLEHISQDSQMLEAIDRSLRAI